VCVFVSVCVFEFMFVYTCLCVNECIMCVHMYLHVCALL
jgi:hypothetical protein